MDDAEAAEKAERDERIGSDDLQKTSDLFDHSKVFFELSAQRTLNT